MRNLKPQIGTDEMFNIYESTFNKIKKKFPLIDKNEGELSQINEKMRNVLCDVEQYVDLIGLRNRLWYLYSIETLNEIDGAILNQFLDELFDVLELKILEHRRIREIIDHIKINEIYIKVIDIEHMLHQGLR